MIQSVARAALGGCLLALLLGLTAGCSEDEVQGGDPAEALQTPSSPDNVIHNLQVVYDRLLVMDYDKLLDDNFTFFFTPVDVDHPDQGASWDRTAEMASATRMFTGQPGTMPGGDLREPIQSFVLKLTPRSTEWSAVVPAAFAGTFHRAYDVAMTVTFHGGATQRVQGIQDLYVAAVEVDGQTQYRLRYWLDVCALPMAKLGADDSHPVTALNADEPVCWSALRMGEF